MEDQNTERDHVATVSVDRDLLDDLLRVGQFLGHDGLDQTLRECVRMLASCAEDVACQMGHKADK